MTSLSRSVPVAAMFAAVLASACGGAGSSPDAGSGRPGAPAGFMVMKMGTSLHATWQDTFSAETGFELQRRLDGAEFATLIELPANATEHMDGSVTASVRYTYRVRAVTVEGAGDWSAEASETAADPVPAPPGAPSNAATMVMGGAVHLSWQDNSSDEDGFEIERQAGSGAFAALASVDANLTQYEDSSVTAGARYVYRVRARKGSARSEWSNDATGMP